jgi:hypothetical protein
MGRTFEPKLHAESPQKVASGFSGDPVPLSIRSGAAMNRNS